MLRSSFTRNVRTLNSIGTRGMFQGDDKGQSIGFDDHSGSSGSGGPVPRSRSVNKVILVGNVGADPQVRHFQDGRSWASFSIATQTTIQGRDREPVLKTEWHNISVKNPKLATITEKIVKKGAQVYVCGSLESNEYTAKDGTERKGWNIVLRYTGELTVLRYPNQQGGEQEKEDAGYSYGDQGQVYD